MAADDERGAKLDELNKATLRSHARNIADRGLSPDDKDSALYLGRSGEADSARHPALLAELRANAEQVYGDAPKGGRAPRSGTA